MIVRLMPACINSHRRCQLSYKSLSLGWSVRRGHTFDSLREKIDPLIYWFTLLKINNYWVHPEHIHIHLNTNLYSTPPFLTELLLLRNRILDKSNYRNLKFWFKVKFVFIFSVSLDLWLWQTFACISFPATK